MNKGEGKKGEGMRKGYGMRKGKGMKKVRRRVRG